MTDTNIFDMKTRKPIERMDISAETNVAQFLNLWKKFAKETGVQSIFILNIDENNHVTWDLRSASEHHALLAYATLDDLKDEIRAVIFPPRDDEDLEIDVDLED